MRASFVVAAAALLALAGCTTGSSEPPQPVSPSREAPVALVYRGPASCDGCPEAAAALLQASDHGFEVVLVGPGEEMDVTAQALDDAALYVQPGGDGTVDRAMEVLGEDWSAAITEFVDDGGRYLGFCMGAYLAGSDPGVGLLSPGDTGRYIEAAGAEITTTDDAVISVLWEGERRLQFAQDPAYIVPSGVAGEQILSTFDNGLANALMRPYGEGMVAVVGTHPEADRTWYTDGLWEQDTDGLDRDAALQLLDAVMGTS